MHGWDATRARRKDLIHRIRCETNRAVNVRPEKELSNVRISESWTMSCEKVFMLLNALMLNVMMLLCVHPLYAMS